jgi:hypothetical protein
MIDCVSVADIRHSARLYSLRWLGLIDEDRGCARINYAFLLKMCPDLYLVHPP